MAPEIKVQRGNTSFGAAEDDKVLSAPGDFTAVGSTSSAFLRPTINVPFNAYPAATTTADVTQRDGGAWGRLTGTGQITISRRSNAANADGKYPWELWEYTGAASGANEFIVRHAGSVSVSDGNTTAQIILPSGTDLTKCVAFLLGCDSNNGNSQWQRALFTAEFKTSGSDKVVELVRGDGTNTVAGCWVVVIEFSGSNWVVQNNITQTISSVGSDVEKSITSVADTSKAFIVSTLRAVNADSAALSFTARFKDAGAIYLRQHSDANTGSVWIGATVRNDSILKVTHYDSITGGLSDYPTDQDSVTRSITAVANLAHSALICSTASAGTNNDPPENVLAYRYTDTSTVEFFCPRKGQLHELVIQAIEFLEAGATEALAAEAASTSGATGSLSSTVPIAGAAASSSSAAGALSATVLLQATGASASGGAAALSSTVPVAGEAGSASSSAGALTILAGLEAAAGSTSSAAGALSATVPLAGPAAATSSSTATLGATVPLEAAAGATSAGSATLTTGGEITLAGEAASTSGATGGLSSTVPLEARTGASSASLAALSAHVPLQATAASASSSTASLVLQVSHRGIASASSATTGALYATVPLAGAAAGASSSTATLGATVPLEGAAGAISGASASLAAGADEALAGVAAAVSAAAGAVSALRALAGAGGSNSSAAGALIFLRRLASNAGASSSTSGALDVERGLASTFSASSGATGKLLITPYRPGAPAQTLAGESSPALAGSEQERLRQFGSITLAGEAATYRIVGDTSAVFSGD